MQQAFAVYWRAGNRQHVQATSPQEARCLLRSALKRKSPVMVGVKQLAACGRRCAHNGRWVG